MLSAKDTKTSRASRMTNYQRRDETIDVYKGIGIVLMVLDHIAIGYYFGYAIHSFHMPMFFFASGLLFHGTDQPISKYLLKKTRTLLIPYIIFSVFGIVLYTLSNGIQVSVIKNVLWHNTGEMPIAGAIWFLTAFFIASIVYYVIAKHVSNRWLQLIIIGLISFVASFGKFDFLPFGAGAAAVGLFYILLGQRIKENRNVYAHLYNMPVILSVFLFVLAITITFMNSYVNLRLSHYGNPALFWLSSIIAVIALLPISHQLSRIRCARLLKSCGQYSLIILGMNQIMIAISQKLIEFFIPSKGGLYTMLVIINVGLLLYLSCYTWDFVKNYFLCKNKIVEEGK